MLFTHRVKTSALAAVTHVNGTARIQTLSSVTNRNLYELLIAFKARTYNLVHLIYRPKAYEGDSKDYEFSRLSMAEHWRSGYSDTMRTLRHPEVLERTGNGKEFTIFDFAGDDA